MFGLKKHYLLDPGITFLNHGSFGATPRPVFRAYQHWQKELETQPVEFLGRRITGLLQDARSCLAEYLGAQRDDLVFTSNVTMSLNIVARSLDLGPGDEVLASDHEYGAMDRTWRFLARERGFAYLRQPIPVPLSTTEAFLAELWKGVTPRTRVIFLSHITSPTALIFPVEAVVRRARQAGILSVIDGAHVPGQLALDLDALGADFYGGNLHKWLSAPKGAGFLHARADVQPLLKPLVVSWGYESETPGPSSFVDQHEWWGTRDMSAFLAVPDAIRFQREHDWGRVRTACHELLRQAQAQIEELTGLPPFHPDEPAWSCQMAGTPLPARMDVLSLKRRLYEEYRIEIPVIDWNGRKLLRMSAQGYNTRADFSRLLAALRTLLSEG